MRRSVLPHGLQVVTEALPASRTFSIGVFAPVGSRHETPALHGASHFLEHVLFKGTRRRTAEQVSAAVESVGGELNAYTAKEHTCFYARVLHSDAEIAVDVLADMIAHSRVAGADVESERAVILDEIAMHRDDPAEVAADLAAAEVHPGGGAVLGLGRPVIGSPDSIGQMSRAQIVRHWRRHYQPAGLVVAAAGHVDHDVLLDQLAGLDDRPAQGAPRRTRAVRPAPVPGGRVVARKVALEQDTAVLGFPGPGVFDDRRYPLGLLSLIVGGGMSSRLFLEIRERRGLTYSIDAGETAYSDAGLWSVEWQCAPDRLAPILELVRAVLADVAEHGVTADELRRAKGQIRGQTVLAYESAASRMSRLGHNAVLGDVRGLEEVLARFDAVPLSELQAAAGTLFDHPPVLAVVGPRAPTRKVHTRLATW